MFDYTSLHWTSFLAAAFLLNVSPGPDIAFILAQTLRGGRRGGFMALLGVWSGALCHVAMAALGLSAIIASSALAFSAVKWIGAAYLIWLGLSAFRTGAAVATETPPPRPSAGVYRQGIIVSLTNPKVAIFFLAFLPQFVVAGAGPVPAQLMLHGLLIIAVAACIEPFVVLFADMAVTRLGRNGRLAVWLERAFGSLMIGLGVSLAFEKL
jgi:threonine/homoserine/homoserine lactone efflux protein